MRVLSRIIMSGALLVAATNVAVAQATTPATTPAPAAAPSGPLKFAYLNSNEVLEGAPGRAEALALFEKETQPMRTQMQRMSDSLQSIIGEYQKAAAQLTAAQRTAKESSIGAKQQEYQQRAQEMQQKAQARQEQLMAPVMEQVNKVIQDVRSEDGYSFIFDAGAQVPFIVSADKSLDITARVIDRLKTLGAPKLPAPTVASPAAGPTKPATTGPVASPAGVARPTRP